MKYFCLLRGINVSGQKLIKMEILREVFTNMQLKNARSYIQSGNILFDSEETQEVSLVKRIEHQMIESFGYSVSIFLRNYQEWENIISSNPYKELLGDANFKFYITFLSALPVADLQNKVKDLSTKREKFYLHEREIYSMVTKDSIENQLFSNNYMEKILRMPATTRNVTTVQKLLSY